VDGTGEVLVAAVSLGSVLPWCVVAVRARAAPVVGGASGTALTGTALLPADGPAPWSPVDANWMPLPGSEMRPLAEGQAWSS